MVLRAVVFVVIIILTGPSIGLALTITQPKANAVFHPGDTVRVLAEAGPGEQFVPGVMLDATDIDGGVDIRAPYEFEFKIPKERLGSIRITAAGKTRDGRVLQNEIRILVVLPSGLKLQKLKAAPDPLFLFKLPVGSDPNEVRIFETKSLSVGGTFSDGVKRSVTSSAAGTTYESSNSKVVTVDPEGVVTAVAPGNAEITIRNGDQKAVVEAVVKQEQ